MKQEETRSQEKSRVKMRKTRWEGMRQDEKRQENEKQTDKKSRHENKMRGVERVDTRRDIKKE